MKLFRFREPCFMHQRPQRTGIKPDSPWALVFGHYFSLAILLKSVYFFLTAVICLDVFLLEFSLLLSLENI